MKLIICSFCSRTTAQTPACARWEKSSNMRNKSLWVSTVSWSSGDRSYTNTYKQCNDWVRFSSTFWRRTWACGAACDAGHLSPVSNDWNMDHGNWPSCYAWLCFQVSVCLLLLLLLPSDFRCQSFDALPLQLTSTPSCSLSMSFRLLRSLGARTLLLPRQSHFDDPTARKICLDSDDAKHFSTSTVTHISITFFDGYVAHLIYIRRSCKRSSQRWHNSTGFGWCPLTNMALTWWCMLNQDDLLLPLHLWHELLCTFQSQCFDGCVDYLNVVPFQHYVDQSTSVGSLSWETRTHRGGGEGQAHAELSADLCQVTKTARFHCDYDGHLEEKGVREQVEDGDSKGSPWISSSFFSYCSASNSSR